MVCATLGLLLLVGGLLAVQAPPASPNTSTTVGILKEFDPATGTLTVMVGDAVKTFRLGRDARIVDEQGQPLSVDDRTAQLVPGAQVTVTIQSQGQGQVQIETIKIKKKKVPPPAPTQGGKDKKQQPPQPR